VEGAGGDVIDVRRGDVVGLDLFQDLGVDAHLAIGTIGVGAGVHAEHAEFAQDETQAEAGENGYGQNEDETLEESRHTHHRGAAS